MNRILFESSEIENGVATFGGVRAEHVLDVLHGEVGQVLKTGEVNGLIGTSEILEITECSNKGTSELANEGGEKVGAGAFLPPQIKVRVHHTQPSLAPWVDLILAPPRPRVMKRLLPQLATMGVGRIVLVGAKKVEKDFWGATLLKEENYRPLLIEGLMQGGTSILPTLETRRNFRRFMTDELDTLFPTKRRVVAHPYVEKAKARGEELEEAKARGEEEEEAKARGEGEGRSFPSDSVAQPVEEASRLLVKKDVFGNVTRLNASSTKERARHPSPSPLAFASSSSSPLAFGSPSLRQLLAIGPEGGWTDEEVALLEAHGFARYSLGSRILRTDTATIALLAKLNDE